MLEGVGVPDVVLSVKPEEVRHNLLSSAGGGGGGGEGGRDTGRSDLVDGVELSRSPVALESRWRGRKGAGCVGTRRSSSGPARGGESGGPVLVEEEAESSSARPAAGIPFDVAAR